MTTNNVTAIVGPGRPGLSFETYEQAYYELTSEDGTPPSQRQLRKYLGTGSNTTLANYRRRIAEERVIDEKPLEPGTVDAEILATVQLLAHQIHLNEAQMADDRLNELKAEAENRVRIAETTMEKRLQDTDLLEYRATQAETEVTELRKQLSESNAASSVLIAELQDMKEDKVAVSQTLSSAEEQIALLKHKLAQHEDALETTQAANREATSALSEQQSALAIVEKALSQKEIMLAAVTEKHESLSERFDEHVRLTETQIEQQRDLQRRFDQSMQSLDSVSTQLDDVKSERDELLLKYKELSIASTATEQLSKAKAQTLAEDVTDKAKQIAHLQKTVSDLATQHHKS
jgi:chromosome segregation ATPase